MICNLQQRCWRSRGVGRGGAALQQHAHPQAVDPVRRLCGRPRQHGAQQVPTYLTLSTIPTESYWLLVPFVNIQNQD